MSGANQPRRVRLQVDERRTQIVAAARKLFAMRPYSEVSTTDLAEAAGITRANLYYHLGTKRQLFLEVVRAFTQLPPLPEEHRSHPLTDAIDEIVSRWLDTVWRTRDTYLSIFRAGTIGSDPELEEILESGREAWANRLAEVLPINGTASPRSLALIRAYQAMAEDAVDEWLRRGRLTRADVQLLLDETLMVLIERIAPAPSDGEPSPPPPISSAGSGPAR
jgi:AcrR family transcriptional regulator